jgi:hypothetical protein
MGCGISLQGSRHRSWVPTGRFWCSENGGFSKRKATLPTVQ